MNLEDVQRILAIVEQSHFTEIDLRIGDVHIVAKKGGSGERPDGQLTRTAAATTAEPSLLPTSSAPAEQPGTAWGDDEYDGHVVRAPMVGTFFRAPSPGAEPFAKEGDVVSPSTTVGSLEVMKLYNSVDAGIDGTVVKFLAENGDLVEFGQPLVLIEPAQA